jgi:general L-amino acid transport system substrate-binding protein
MVSGEVQERGSLNCGVTTGLSALQRRTPMANGKASTLRVCRAVAAAVLGDPMAVEFVPTTGKTRFTALASGEIDMLARNTTWTFSRDVDLKFEFVGINYYDGQGFMVPRTGRDLGHGARRRDRLHPDRHHDRAEPRGLLPSNNMSYEPVPIETNAEAQQQYLAGACDVYTTDASGLAATRATFEDPGDHVICPRSSPKSRSARSCVTATTSGATSSAGR